MIDRRHTPSHLTRFYFLYLVIDFVGIGVIYLTFVETRGRSLEELDTIFEQENPVRASLAMQEVAVHETESGDVEVLGRA